MLVEECTSITEWNTWLLATTIHTPLVAHGQWGQLLEREGSRVRYFFVREHKQIIAGFYLIIIKKRFFSHAYSPRGPIVMAGGLKTLDRLVKLKAESECSTITNIF
jgi:lipid II:glycine glycyltransferase (peptidoglycan interpeptide bridge formation enzyme)